MSSDHLMRIHSPEFQAMAERVLRVTELTSRLNVLPFENESGKAELLEQILGKPLPAKLTIYPPFYTDRNFSGCSDDYRSVGRKPALPFYFQLDWGVFHVVLHRAGQ